MAKISRRHLLTGSAAVGAGLASLVFVEDGVRAATTTPSGSRIMAIVRHAGSHAQVALPGAADSTAETVAVHGFPPSWQLQPGDLVLVTGPRADSPNTAYPLVRRLVGKVERTARSARVAGSTMELRPQTIQDRTAITDRRVVGPKFEAYVIENSRSATLSCVALRPTAV